MPESIRSESVGNAPRSVAACGDSRSVSRRGSRPRRGDGDTVRRTREIHQGKLRRDVLWSVCSALELRPKRECSGNPRENIRGAKLVGQSGLRKGHHRSAQIRSIDQPQGHLTEVYGDRRDDDDVERRRHLRMGEAPETYERWSLRGGGSTDRRGDLRNWRSGRHRPDTDPRSTITRWQRDRERRYTALECDSSHGFIPPQQREREHHEAAITVSTPQGDANLVLPCRQLTEPHLLQSRRSLAVQLRGRTGINTLWFDHELHRSTTRVPFNKRVDRHVMRCKGPMPETRAMIASPRVAG